MAVTDYNLYDAMNAGFRFGGDVGRLEGRGFAESRGDAALTFVENHDVGAPPNRYLAYAFLAAYPGYPMFSAAAIDDPTLKNLVWVHRYKALGRVFNRYSARDFIVFEREGNLLAGINQSGDWVHVWVSTSFSNRGLHDYAGHVNDVWVAGDGRVEVHIPPMSWVMLGT
jgi:alpha-amylase